MYDYGLSILEQYGLKADIYTRTRGGLLCRTDQGTVIIKEFKGNETKLERQQELLAKLTEKGHRVDIFVRNKEESLITRDKDNISYTMQCCYEGKECDTRSETEILTAVEKLAELHKDMKMDPGEKEKIPDLETEYEKHNRELRKIRKFIRKKRPACVFEKKYLESAEDFLKNGEEALEMLKSSNYQELRQKAEETGTVCHGEYNHHNVIFFRQGIAVTNFNRWSCDIQMKDFYGFMRKILEKHNWDTELAGRMLRTYHRKKGISREEWQYLKIRFAYPDKYWKLADYYYTHNKAWISARNTEKLRKLTEQKSRWERFIWKCFQKYPF